METGSAAVRPRALATEGDVVWALEKGTRTLERIYATVAERADISRDGGCDPIPGHAGDVRWKRRVRGHLANMRRADRADRLGRTWWAIRGTPDAPSRLLLIVAGATPAEFELSLQSALDMLRELDEPADLVLADPPYGLGRGDGKHYSDGNGYRRDSSKIVGGYVDVPQHLYSEFTSTWVHAAAGALRRGGQLAVFTGPQRAAIVQCAAETAGLTWVSSIAAGRQFPIATTRRPSPAHWVLTIMCKSTLTHPRRVFNPPPDLPAARSGRLYPLDWWPAEYNGRADRPGLIRHDNSLPLRMTLRAVRMLTDPGEHVAVPFLGGGTEAVACWMTGRRLTASDVNPGAIRFTAARLLVEHAWPADTQPALFPVLN
jgi:DNA modification methylase